MIAFEELVAALDRWRIRNNLPVVTGDVPTAAVATAPAAAAWSPPAAPAWAAAPAPAVASVGDTSDVLSIGDADVVDDEYDNDGADFAVGFAGGAAPDPEATANGPVPTAPPPAMPAYGDPAAPAYDAYAAPGSGPYGQPGSGPYSDPSYSQETPPPPGSGPYAAPADPYAQAPSDSGGAYAVSSESDPAFDDPAYDPPAEGYDQAAYAPPAGGAIDADDEVLDEATVVGDELPKR